MDKISVTLPYPAHISVNNCWKRGKKGIYLNHLVKVYREEVYYICNKLEKLGQCSIRLEIYMYPPDNRVRDIDNILKVVLDALQYAGVYDNDKKVEQLYVEKKDKIKDGKLEITIKPLHNKKS